MIWPRLNQADGLSLVGPTVLVIDGESVERDQAVQWLTQAGYQSIGAEDVSSGLRELYNYHPDAVIFAINGIEANGWAGVERIRELCDIPIILVTSRASSGSLRKAFDLGLDGYLVKPLHVQQLIGRLSTVLRKAGNNHRVSSSVFRHEDLIIDWNRFEVCVNGRVVRLSPTEFKLLSLLVKRRGWVLTYDQILSHVWGTNYIGDRDSVKLYIWYLRRKLERDPSHPRWILTKYGIGYSFVDELPTELSLSWPPRSRPAEV